MGIDFKSPRIHLRCELLGPCEQAGGLQGERVRTEFIGIDFKSPTIHLRCELLEPYEKDGDCPGRGSELNS